MIAISKYMFTLLIDLEEKNHAYTCVKYNTCRQQRLFIENIFQRIL